MSTAALIMMVASQGVVTLVTAYFFYKVLASPAPAHHDEVIEEVIHTK
jgi:hypothetical protein